MFLSLPQSSEQVLGLSRGLEEMPPADVPTPPSPDSPGPPPATTPRQLSDADRLRKVISELVETERTYVKVSPIKPLPWAFNLTPGLGVP